MSRLSASSAPVAAHAALPAGPLLAVHAHPDDETLATGGLLATWAALGQPVIVVTCTRGEQGEVIGQDPQRLEGDGPALAAHREGELAQALAALGVAEHHFLDQLEPAEADLRYEDSGMQWVGHDGAGHSGQAAATADTAPGAFVGAPLDGPAGRLAELVRRRQPSVVVTYEPGGGYGHPDHVRAHEVTMRAVELAREPSPTSPAHRSVEVWWAVLPPDVLRAGRERLQEWAREPGARLGGTVDGDAVRARSATLPDPRGPLPAVASGDHAADVVLDVRGVLDQVEAALRAHRTQVQWISRRPTPDPDDVLAGTFALSNDILVPWMTHEFYARATRPVHATPTDQR